MTNSYKTEKKNLLTLLNDIDSFETLIKLFKEKHPEYEYEVKIEKVVDEKGLKWVAFLNIINDDGKYSTQTS